jgi:uncharacterized protein (DUF1330 family)
MSAYLFVNIEITDPAGFDAYRKAVSPTIAAHGGRYITRGGPTEVLEGDWQPRRVVILEFPDVARLKAWYHSPEYRPLIEIRKRTSITDMVIVEGI